MSELVAIVTGSSSGIGRAVVEQLTAEGVSVAGFDVQGGAARNSLSVLVDVSRESTVKAGVDRVLEELGRIDIVVNCAGIGAVGSIEANCDEEWNRLWDVNVLGIVRIARATLPSLRRSPAAAIVNVASIAATAGLPQRAAYSATKGAVVALTRAMAADMIRDGVRVNCVCPGTVDTPWVGRLLAGAEDEGAARRQLELRQPMGRLASALEVAEAICYLAGRRASFTTGSALAVDGGMQGLRIPMSA